MSTGPSTEPDHVVPPTRRPRLVVVAAVALALVTGLMARPDVAGARSTQAVDTAAAEAEFVAHINGLRASRGLGPLQVDGELTAQARQWAGTMAGQGRIFHSSDLAAGISANWQKLGENVGVGGDVPVLFQAFVDSPSHLANLVDPAYSRVGVGVVVSGGRIYTAHRFMALAPDPPPTTAPPTTAPPVTAPPTTASPSTTTTTAPTTTVAPTTTAPPAEHKLGPLERVVQLVSDS